MKPPEPAPIAKSLPFFQRLRLGTILFLLKCAMAAAGPLTRLKERRLPQNQKPTYKKSYPPLPDHEARIFIPSTYKSGDKPLPLFIDIHGGGFCIGAPWVDDADNCTLCHTHGFCVVSIPYRLGPSYKFPVAPKDCAAMITAVIQDESLPVDKTRVVIGGYSAGGTLSLAAPQILSPEIKKSIKAIVAYYPSTNSAVDTATKIQRQNLPAGRKDSLHWMAYMFSSGYLAPGTNRADPLMSPIFAKRENLPEKIYILGCEWDLLCLEARDMAEDLAELEHGEQVDLRQGRTGWTKGNVQWEMLQDVEHGFNQRFPNDPVMKKKTAAMHQGVADWLKKEVFN